MLTSTIFLYNSMFNNCYRQIVLLKQTIQRFKQKKTAHCYTSALVDTFRTRFVKIFDKTWGNKGLQKREVATKEENISKKLQLFYLVATLYLVATFYLVATLKNKEYIVNIRAKVFLNVN